MPIILNTNIQSLNINPYNSLGNNLTDTLTDEVLHKLSTGFKINPTSDPISINGQKILVTENTSMSVFADEISSIQVYNSKIRGIDFLTLYSLKSEQFIDFNTNSLIYGTPILSAGFNYKYDVNGNCYQYKNDFYDNKIIDEINVDKYLGSYNNIYTDLSFIKPNYFYCITKLDDVTLNYIKGDFKTLQMLENGYINTINGIEDIPDNILKFLVTYYYRGGFNFYNAVMKKLSFSNVAKMINNSSKYIKYISIDNTQIYENDIQITILNPDTIIKNEKIISIRNSNESVLSKKNVNYKIYRYSGNYEPKFNNIISLKIKDSINVDNINYDLDLSNVSFNTKLESFGIIKNLFYNKISDIDILENNSNIKSVKLYSKTDDISIDKKDFYIFKSNWDSDYYRKNVDKKYYASLIGSRNMTEAKSFFGSKLMKIPKSIILENFNTFEVFDYETVDTSLITNECYYYKNSNEIVLNILYKNIIINYFLQNGIKKVFEDNLFFEIMDLDEVTFEDNIVEYIRTNLLNKYYISDIYLYEKTSINNIITINKIQNAIIGFNKNQTFKSKIIDELIQLNILINNTSFKNYLISFKVSRI